MRESAATQRVATNVQPREASSAPVVTLAPLVNHRLICLHSSGLPQRITNVVKYRNVLSSPRRSESEFWIKFRIRDAELQFL